MRSLISLKSSRSNTISAQLALVAVRAGALAGQRLVEVAPVVEAGQRIEVGELARLAEAARVLDRRAGAQRERLELAHVVVGVLVALPAREDGEVAERRAVARKRDGEAGVDDALAGLGDSRSSSG